MRFFIRMAAVFGTSLCLLGCGVKGDPIPYVEAYEPDQAKVDGEKLQDDSNIKPQNSQSSTGEENR